MLVLVSDVHLVDRPSPSSRQSGKLMEKLAELAAKSADRGWDPLTVAFIGDIFDLLHSQKWLDLDLRPWERPTNAHRNLVRGIYRGIKAANPAFFQGLEDLKSSYPDTEFHYIPGNHDRALNTSMGDLVRPEIINDLRLKTTGSIFQDTLVLEGYSTIARHGHEWDSRNIYALERAAIGDFIVIDVLERLPRAMAEATGLDFHDGRLDALREVAFVNPQDSHSLLGWIFAAFHELETALGVSRTQTDRALIEIFDAAEAFIRENQKLFLLPSYLTWFVNVANFKFLRKRRVRFLHAIRLAKKIAFDGNPFHYRAMLTAQSDFGKAFSDRYGVLAAGHTHDALLEGMSEDKNRSFANTGAWGRVHELALGDRKYNRASYRTFDYGNLITVHSSRERSTFGLEFCKLDNQKVLAT
jgi:UDP-2,3-diacylglucosamine pyrophosphatase LpxH